MAAFDGSKKEDIAAQVRTALGEALSFVQTATDDVVAKLQDVSAKLKDAVDNLKE